MLDTRRVLSTVGVILLGLFLAELTTEAMSNLIEIRIDLHRIARALEDRSAAAEGATPASEEGAGESTGSHKG